MYIFDSFVYIGYLPPPEKNVSLSVKNMDLNLRNLSGGKSSLLICFTGRPNVINIRDSMWI